MFAFIESIQIIALYDFGNILWIYGRQLSDFPKLLKDFYI